MLSWLLIFWLGLVTSNVVIRRSPKLSHCKMQVLFKETVRNKLKCTCLFRRKDHFELHELIVRNIHFSISYQEKSPFEPHFSSKSTFNSTKMFQAVPCTPKLNLFRGSSCHLLCNISHVTSYSSKACQTLFRCLSILILRKSSFYQSKLVSHSELDH